MTTNEIYDVLTDAISSIIPDEWAIVRLNVQFLSDGLEVEFDGFYLTPTGDEEPLSTDFPDEMIEAVQELYLIRKNEGLPPANRLQIDLTPQGKFTTDFSWDQEIQDEEEHFNKGGTAREWMAIREAKYGPIED
ncbi:hypothetical protein EXU85_07070 [Spirosoma sp. KCTC 42546]|uniref:hypothetical protein n=1 Tax=Spirosoma sp. KCTC 42546 TaxID=2520506 RepID=UPI00115A0481|nr:hypothetical protein [Spirosoma sp. KCTC 42546]QDK78376.1 hypothetical protein EXU85_07070 [Spirosoma sp. KCTC 42546]